MKRNLIILIAVVAALALAIFSLDLHDPNVQTEAALAGVQDGTAQPAGVSACANIENPALQATCRRQHGDTSSFPPVKGESISPPGDLPAQSAR